MHPRRRPVLLVDNYDSFVFNIVQILREGEIPFALCENDAIPFATLGDFGKIILSAGPGVPETAGDLLRLIDEAKNAHPILGICLGHQAIARFFGCPLKNLAAPAHGVRSALRFENGGDPAFFGVPAARVSREKTGAVGRYHSWSVPAEKLPAELVATSFAEDDGELMSLRHTSLDVRGVQFHPESWMTANGAEMLLRWLRGNGGG